MAAASVCVLKVGRSSPLVSLGDSPRQIDRSGLGSYQITAFALGPGPHKILCALVKSEVSISPSP